MGTAPYRAATQRVSCRGRMVWLAPPFFRLPTRSYWPGEKCTRRFFCQQASLDSVHCGRSFP